MGKNNYQRKQVRRTEEGLYICDRCGEYFEEQDMTRGRFGIIGICKSCTGKAHSEGAKNRKNARAAMEAELQELRIEVADLKRQLKEVGKHALDACTPRDIMIELYNRGYRGELQYTKVTKVDISKLE